MIAIADIALRCGVAPDVLHVWIERRWVLPARDPAGQYAFSDADVARIRLIAELHDDLAVDDDAMEIVLPLIDRVYGLRRRLRSVLSAVAELPEPQRQHILERLAGEDR